MFHWICPECGCEIPPSLKECPACDPKSAPAATVAPAAAAPAVQAPEAAAKSIAPAAAEVPALSAVQTPKPDQAPEFPLDPLYVMAEQIRSAQRERAGVKAPAPPAPVQQTEPAPALAANREPEPVAPAIAPQATPQATPTPEAVAQPAPVIPAAPSVEPRVETPVQLRPPEQTAPTPAVPEPVASEQVAAPAPVIPAPVVAAEQAAPVPTPAESVPQPEPILLRPAPVAAEPTPVAQAAPEPIAPAPLVPVAAAPVPVAAEPVPVAAAPVPLAAAPEPVAAEQTPVAQASPEPVAPVPPPAASKPEPAPVAADQTPVAQAAPEPVAPVSPPAASLPAEPSAPVPVASEPLALVPVAPEQLALVLVSSQPSVSQQPPPSQGLGELAAAVGLTEAPPQRIEREEAAPDFETDAESMAEAEAISQESEPAPAIEQNAAMHDPSVTLALLTPPFGERSRTPLVLPVALAQEKFSPEPVTPQATNQPSSDRLLNDSPPSGSRLALAPLQDYTAVASRKMQPAGGNTKAFASNPGPKITLPGPTLPPELNSFKDANLVAVLSNEKRSKQSASLPGWMVSLLVMMLLLGVGITAVFYVLPSGRSGGETKAAPTEAQASVAQVTPVTQGSSFPLSQYIEVTGFRIVVDFAKKSEIHYLVVNHSAADLSDVTVYVTLQSAKAKPGQPPVCRFSFRSPGLGPFESKEMTSSIEKLSRSVTVPDWSDLRAEVQISQ